jgi:hypothetical protein
MISLRKNAQRNSEISLAFLKGFFTPRSDAMKRTSITQSTNPLTKLLSIPAALALLMAVSPADAATSVTQHGITWSFKDDHQTGQFANGDWWVVGPVTITRITPYDKDPSDGVDMHGTIVNPVINAAQGWDSRVNGTAYDPLKNIAKSLPFKVENNSSIMSAESFEETLTVAHPRQLRTIAILTVLPAAAPPGSFRPPYAGTDKSIRWNKSKLDYGIFKKLKPVDRTPDLAEVEARFEKALIEVKSGWRSNPLRPVTNSPDYGREISQQFGVAALMLNLDFPDSRKETLLVRLVQRGIDIYGSALNGHNWNGNGGHAQGRKLPLLIAAKALGDAEMLSWADASKHFIFQEDHQTFHVTQADVDLARKHTSGRIREAYTPAMIGMPEWSGGHAFNPAEDGSQWGIAYRTVCGAAMIPNVLVARLMNLESAWNWPAFFDYYDRYWSVESPRAKDSTNYIRLFERNMWDAYRLSEAQKAAAIGKPSMKVVPDLASDTGFSVVLSTTTPGALIYYSIDGTTPSSSSSIYALPIVLNQETRIKAIAVGYGLKATAVEEWLVSRATATDSPPVTNPPVEEPPVLNPPAEEPPVLNPPAEEPPVLNPPAEEPPVVNPPAEEPPVLNPPAEDPPVPQPPLVESPKKNPPGKVRGLKLVN